MSSTSYLSVPILTNGAGQWRRPQTAQQTAPLDGFTVRRTGDSITKVRVMMYIDHYPDQFKVGPELSAILDLKEDSRIGVVTALWNYIKMNNLQDKTDRRIIRTDEKLKVVCLCTMLWLMKRFNTIDSWSARTQWHSSKFRSLSTTTYTHLTP